MSTAPVQPSLAYYIGLFTSEYQGQDTSPNLLALAALFMQPFLDVSACADALPLAFNINPTLGAMAIGAQLDAVGTVVGASRTLPFVPGNSIATAVIDAPGSGYENGDLLTLVQAGASGGTVTYNSTGPTIVIANVGAGYTNATGLATTGGHGTGLTVMITTTAWSSVLSDAHYLLLIQAKIIQNQWNGQGQGANSTLWQSWQTMFSGGHIYITDNQNMTCSIFLIGAFDGLVQQMITNGLIVPRPEGVQYIYEFPQLPVFGFDDLNPSFVAGFDTGYWA